MRLPAAPARPPSLTVPLRLQARPPIKAPVRASWLKRWLGRPEPTLYQRCLAIHIHFASPRSPLS